MHPMSIGNFIKLLAALGYKLETLTNLFEDKEIRSIWDKDKEDYYYNVVDVIAALTESGRERKYLNDIKTNLKKKVVSCPKKSDN